MQLGAVAVTHDALVGNHVQLTELKRVGALVGSPTQVGAHAREQLFGHEGLGHVVVGARFESEDDVGRFVARRDDHDRHVARGAHGLTGLKARHARQHDVHDRDVRGHAREERHAELAGRRVVHVEAFALEHQLEGGANVVVVFHNQNTGHPNSFGISAKTSNPAPSGRSIVA